MWQYPLSRDAAVGIDLQGDVVVAVVMHRRARSTRIFTRAPLTIS